MARLGKPRRRTLSRWLQMMLRGVLEPPVASGETWDGPRATFLYGVNNFLGFGNFFGEIGEIGEIRIFNRRRF